MFIDPIIVAAGPFTDSPAIKGLIAIFGALLTCNSFFIPGTARIGPILSSGLEGAITITLAFFKAFTASSVGFDSEAPS